MVGFEKVLLGLLALDAAAVLAVPIVYYFALRRRRP
jgi:hypothetical protein